MTHARAHIERGATPMYNMFLLFSGPTISRLACGKGDLPVVTRVVGEVRVAVVTHPARCRWAPSVGCRGSDSNCSLAQASACAPLSRGLAGVTRGQRLSFRNCPKLTILSLKRGGKLYAQTSAAEKQTDVDLCCGPSFSFCLIRHSI